VYNFFFQSNLSTISFVHRFASGNDEDFMRSSWAVKKLTGEKMAKSNTHANVYCMAGALDFFF
jgi:hypothetical protein